MRSERDGGGVALSPASCSTYVAGPLRAPASSFSLGCRCASSPCVTFTAPASGMAWIFNPRRKATKSVRPCCRLKINTAEAAIDAPIAGVGVTNVLPYQIARARAREAQARPAGL